ncbi:AAA family ATPase [Elizabethkingia anophelis]|nr:AAA family ATPase [Elizabethkingia anophelis]
MSLKFYIKSLSLTGRGKSDATIEFKKGLNVISGASNTGKTFIFQCLNYMLGAQTPPKKDIREAKGYDMANLIIIDNNNIEYTIKRSIIENKPPFFIKVEDGKFEKYIAKLDNDPKNISTFLLSLCGLNRDIKLKKNKLNSVNRLSFRDIAGLTLVNEKDVISEKSPIFSSGNYTEMTKEISLFKFFISDKDDSNLQEIEDPKIRTSKINGQIDFLDELIREKEKELIKYGGKDSKDPDQELEKEYESLNLEYKTTIEEIDNTRNERSIHYQEYERIDSTIIFNNELLQRFELLQKHYESDINRLEFISEGTFLINQLNDISCPICGGEITEEHHKHLTDIQLENKYFEQSIDAELNKLKLKKEDLKETIEKICKENNKLNNKKDLIQDALKKYDKALQVSLVPVSLSLKQRLYAISALKIKFHSNKMIQKELTDLYEKYQKLILLKNQKENLSVVTFDLSKDLKGFCDVIKQVLKSWNFPDIKSVTFDNDPKIFDIIINGSNRGDNGKGYRAITFTAFLYSLLLYNLSHYDTHSGVFIIDSPLTTFKEGEEEDSSKTLINGIEYSFFDSLINSSTDHQVIIFENKEPDEKLKAKMNYIHFSGKSDFGRYGFFEPIIDKD